MKKIILAIMLILCCVYLDYVYQPSSVQIGERFMIVVTGNYTSGGDSAWLAMMLPNGFQVDSLVYLTSDTAAGVLTEMDTALCAYFDSLYPCDSNMCWCGYKDYFELWDSSGMYAARVYILVTDSTIPGVYNIDYLSGYGSSYYTIGDSIFDRPMEVTGSAVKEQNGEGAFFGLSVAPNPFSEETRIAFGIGHRAKSIELQIYDISGRVVKSFRITRDALRATQIVWNGTDQSDRPLPAGTYIVKLSADGCYETKKVLLVR